MNVKQSWSRHGEEVKDAGAGIVEWSLYILGIFSPFIFMWISGFTI